MTSQRFLVLGVLGAIALIAAFWFVLLSPKRSEVGVVEAAIEQADTRRAAAAAAAGQGEHARARYQDDYATLARIGKAVPQDDDIASLVYQLETIARAHKIDFRAVKLTAETSTAAAPAPAAEQPKEGEDAKPGENAKPGGSSDSTGDSAAPVAPVVAQPPPGAVVGTAGLLTVPFTFTFDGDYLKLQRFLNAIDGLANGEGERITVRGRLLTVDGFSLAAGPKGFPQLKALVSATAYLAPPNDSPAGGAEAAGAAAGAPTTTAMTTSNGQGAGR